MARIGLSGDLKKVALILQKPSKGFTLVELIMVIVILGVLAIYAMPRMFESQDFYAKGFHDETMAYLRFAQKTAIAQRRTVCVTFSANSLTLASALNAPTAAAANADCASAATTFSGPKGESPPMLEAKGTVTYTAAAPATLNFNFNGLGQPTTSAGVVLTAARTLQVNGAEKSITVEADTGYVHE